VIPASRTTCGSASLPFWLLSEVVDFLSHVSFFSLRFMDSAPPPSNFDFLAAASSSPRRQTPARALFSLIQAASFVFLFVFLPRFFAFRARKPKSSPFLNSFFPPPMTFFLPRARRFSATHLSVFERGLKRRVVDFSPFPRVSAALFGAGVRRPFSHLSWLLLKSFSAWTIPFRYFHHISHLSFSPSSLSFSFFVFFLRSSDPSYG